MMKKVAKVVVMVVAVGVISIVAGSAIADVEQEREVWDEESGTDAPSLIDDLGVFIDSNWPLFASAGTIIGVLYGYARGYQTGYDEAVVGDLDE
ncbi:hypothetical protein [Natrinema gari]|nr:hypothetical protein [Natrinema gari]